MGYSLIIDPDEATATELFLDCADRFAGDMQAYASAKYTDVVVNDAGAYVFLHTESGWRVLESPASLPVSVPEFPALSGSAQLAIE